MALSRRDPGCGDVCCELYSLQRREIDDEAVAHVALEHALVGVIDVLHRDHLDVGQHVLLGAEIQHLLRLLNAADQGACQGAAVEDGA